MRRTAGAAFQRSAVSTEKVGRWRNWGAQRRLYLREHRKLQPAFKIRCRI